MKKTLQLGKVDYEGTGRIENAVELSWELEDKGRGLVFSMCGAIWNRQHSDHISGGQNIDEIAALFPDNAQVQRMHEIWQRWHLNDLKAGCEHQRAEGWHERPIDPSKPINSYGKHFEGQSHDSWNLLGWVRKSEHPEGLMCKPCPVCGYKYGTAWLYEPIPEDVLAEIRSW